MAMEEDPDRDTGKKARRREEARLRRGARSDLVQELASEVAGAPEEVRPTLPFYCFPGQFILVYTPSPPASTPASNFSIPS